MGSPLNNLVPVMSFFLGILPEKNMGPDTAYPDAVLMLVPGVATVFAVFCIASSPIHQISHAS